MQIHQPYHWKIGTRPVPLTLVLFTQVNGKEDKDYDVQFVPDKGTFFLSFPRWTKWRRLSNALLIFRTKSILECSYKVWPDPTVCVAAFLILNLLIRKIFAKCLFGYQLHICSVSFSLAQHTDSHVQTKLEVNLPAYNKRSHLILISLQQRYQATRP